MFSHRLIVAAGGLVALLSAPVRAHDAEEFRALLTGFREVPVISTTGDGTFRARINAEESAITFTLRYRDLEGEVTGAHIHLGQEDVIGAIVLFLCSNLPDPPPDTPPCPGPREGEVTGTLTAADVQAVPDQLIAAGELREVLDALRRGKTYVNVHSTLAPAGEIRGQIE
jgi:hypothetical protein